LLARTFFQQVIMNTDNNNADYQKWIIIGGFALIFILIVFFDYRVRSVIIGILRVDFQGEQTSSINYPNSQKAVSTNDCQNAYGGRLQTGDSAEIIIFQVAVRNRPGGSDGTPYLNVLAKGQRVEILEGSTCMNGWYYVRIQSPIIDQIGWIAEGDNEQYFLR